MIDRGSDKHGSRLDDALAQDVQGAVRGGGTTHAEEWLDPEPVGEDQPDIGTGGARVRGTPAGMSHEDVDRRADLAARLGRAVFPADAAALRTHLAAEAAPDALRDMLADLPTDRDYRSVGEVWTALGLPHEEHRF
jgi:Protein of unknown function (DUF2795)